MSIFVLSIITIFFIGLVLWLYYDIVTSPVSNPAANLRVPNKFTALYFGVLVVVLLAPLVIGAMEEINALSPQSYDRMLLVVIAITSLFPLFVKILKERAFIDRIITVTSLICFSSVIFALLKSNTIDDSFYNSSLGSFIFWFSATHALMIAVYYWELVMLRGEYF